MGTININGKMQEATCPQERIAMLDTFEALGGKWKLPILRYLSNRPDEQNTFKKMQRELGAISAKVLTQELKELETNQLITRTVLPTKPVMVAYQVTQHGLTVIPLTDQIVQWGLNHRTELR
ncbi:winged helix-turn-helix transcriptional regulator [Mucilaginibacter kameinonensis]|uniref:winged helix-turn-helix transcriptional regulator n=1 Tax=Mucilaginibacter kameinonensis TaxID=452286 RepID=UPI000EF7F565|nr:helix-turn-helix domain-containing protein [Mucilaginibacter kameinonensis]